jgi:hypothetical protein
MCLLARVVNSHTVMVVMAVKRMRREYGFQTIPPTRTITNKAPVMVRMIRFFTIL